MWSLHCWKTTQFNCFAIHIFIFISFRSFFIHFYSFQHICIYYTYTVHIQSIYKSRTWLNSLLNFIYTYIHISSFHIGSVHQCNISLFFNIFVRYIIRMHSFHFKKENWIFSVIKIDETLNFMINIVNFQFLFQIDLSKYSDD